MNSLNLSSPLVAALRGTAAHSLPPRLAHCLQADLLYRKVAPLHAAGSSLYRRLRCSPSHARSHASEEQGGAEHSSRQAAPKAADSQRSVQAPREITNPTRKRSRRSLTTRPASPSTRPSPAASQQAPSSSRDSTLSSPAPPVQSPQHSASDNGAPSSSSSAAEYSTASHAASSTPTFQNTHQHSNWGGDSGAEVHSAVSSHSSSSNSSSSSTRGAGADSTDSSQSSWSRIGSGRAASSSSSSAARQPSPRSRRVSDSRPPAGPDTRLLDGIRELQKEQVPVRPNVELQPLSEEMLRFFEQRKITEATLDRFGVKMASQVYCHALKQRVNAIAFPYMRDGELVNVKYRALPKTFWQERNAEKVLFGYDQVVQLHGPSPKELIIVEGEMDVLALNEAGYTNVVSVPDGAPAVARPASSTSSPLATTKFSYLGNSWSLLERADKFVIATDNDSPGSALAEELMRRLNRELCWRVKWSEVGPSEVPLHAHDSAEAQAADTADAAGAVGSIFQEEEGEGEGEIEQGEGEGLELGEQAVDAGAAGDGLREFNGGMLAEQGPDSGYRKDGNEVLVKDGPEAVRERVGAAEPSPIVGLYRFQHYLVDILAQYHNLDNQSMAYSTGWPQALDPIYKVVPGEVSIVSGVPNSGKSEWIDALLMNLACHHGWGFAMCSLEKTPDKHAIQLIEKVIGKPFYERWDFVEDENGEYVKDEEGQLVVELMPRMSEEEVLQGLEWINSRFQIISNVGNDFPTIDWILDKARAAVLRWGIRGLVIDPYNEINHARPRDMNETEYVSLMMSKVKKFAQAYDVAVWFVAHPRQQHAWTGGAPDMYSISGSANFVNKADNVIMVHRPYQPKAGLEKEFKGSKQQELLPNEVQIFLCKVRNKLAGTRSEHPARLSYHRSSGRYREGPAHQFARELSSVAGPEFPGWHGPYPDEEYRDANAEDDEDYYDCTGGSYDPRSSYEKALEHDQQAREALH